MKLSIFGSWLLATGLCAGMGCSSDVAGPNQAPVARAGPDRSVPAGTAALLDGRSSYDPDGDTLRYRWELVAVPDNSTAILSEVNLPTVELTPDVIGVWVVKLTVNDGALDSEPDLVQVRSSRGCESHQDCDDGLYCTDDRCEDLLCVHQPRDCGEVEDPCNTSTCNEDADACEAVPLPDDTACEDGYWCTVNDACQQGVCESEPRDCSAAAGECNEGVCRELLEQCEEVPVTDGTLCDDGFFCTVGEECTNGSCGGGLPRDCTAASGGCVDGICNEDADACVGDPLDSGTTCSDGDWCTVGDVCDGLGECLGTARDCSAFDSQCTVGTCDGDNATCVAEPINEGTSCNDGLFCTLGETCQNGSCSGMDNACNDGDDCTDDSCDEAGDACVNLLVPLPGQEGLVVGGTCTDGLDNDCDRLIDNQDPDCQQCQDDSDCNDGNNCTVNTCNASSQCETANVANGGSCDDQQQCTMSDMCTDGVCGGSDVDCSNLDDQCNQGVCNPANGQCQPQPINENQSCDDAVFCNVNETCQAGSCTGGEPRDCSHLDDQCNLGACDEGADQCQQQAANQGAGCDDGLYCNDGETCQSGSCTGGGPRDCSFLTDQCNDGVCDEVGSQCLQQYKPPGTGCDDGVYCNGTDQCNDSGLCSVNSGNPCLPGSECNQTCNEGPENCFDDVTQGCGNFNDTQCDNPDTCDGAGSCSPNYEDSGFSCGLSDDTECDNPDSCDGAGVCLENFEPAGTICGSGSGGECDAQDTCDGAGTCQDNQANPGDPCGDPTEDLPCNGADTCDAAGVCQSNDASAGTGCGDPTDDPPCNSPDSCDGAGACLANDAGAGLPCDDTDLCTINDACDGLGGCAGDDKVTTPVASGGCDDGLICTDDDCNAATGTCLYSYSVGPCDDGVDCTTGDQCDGTGNCAGVSDHTWCQDNSLGDLCAPACSTDPSGCATRPSSMGLTCDNPVDLNVTDQAACTINLPDGTNLGQADCLSCQARTGFITLFHTDFEDDSSPGACAPIADGRIDGWLFYTGNDCYQDTNQCSMFNPSRNCCDDGGGGGPPCPIVSASQLNGEIAFQVARNRCTNGDRGAWRLERTVDTSDIGDLQLCFDWADWNADNNDTIQVEVTDGGGGFQEVFCSQFGPLLDADNSWFRRCFDLDPFAESNPNLTITFWMHSNEDNEQLFVDNITLTGWGGGCTPGAPVTLLDETFDDGGGGCDFTTNGWSFSNSNWNCPGFTCSPDLGWDPGVESDQEIFSMSTFLDTTGVDDAIEVCFGFGTDGSHQDDRIDLWYDAGLGAGPRQVWSSNDIMGPNQECRTMCVDLVDPDGLLGISGNPALEIGFNFDSTGAKLDIYWVTVTGMLLCPDDPAVVALSAPPVEQGGGSYDFSATDVFGFSLGARVECSWDPDASLSASAPVTYRNDFPYKWTRRRMVTFGNPGPGAQELFDFPALVRLDGSRIEYAYTQDGGQDLRFYDSLTGQMLPHEIEVWDETGDSVVWVKVPHIPAIINIGRYWMYYGNPSAPDGQRPNQVWDSNFLGVWHLAESSGPAVDSTGRGNHGTYVGADRQQPGGFGDIGIYCDGGNDYVMLDGLDVQGGDGGLTLEAFLQLAVNTSEDMRLISKATGGGGDEHWWMLSLNNGGPLRFRLKLDGTTTTMVAPSGTDVPEGPWFYAVATYDGSQMRLYLDGVEVESAGASGTISVDPGVQAWIGANPPSEYAEWEGMIGEVRISNTGRPAWWIVQQNRYMSDNFTYVILGPPEVY